MNPNRVENHLQPEMAPAPENSEAAPGQPVEQAPSAQESSPGKQAPQTTAVTPVVDPASLAQPAAAIPVADNVVASPAQATGTPAKDGDRIEKEWIDRAKDIVAKTLDDPHAQKEAVSKAKAEYIQKRFNKAIRTDSTVS